MRYPTLLLMLLSTLGCGDGSSSSGGPARPGTSSPAADAKTASWEDAQPATPFTSAYPKDTSPPRGTRYPCAFTPLPPAMEGIPPHLHPFLDRCLGRVVEAIHARLRAELALAVARQRGTEDEAAAAAYEKTIDGLLPQLAAIETPGSLAGLTGQIAEAITLQKTIYAAALRGGDLDRSAHGRSGQLLRQVWTRLQTRCPKMAPAVNKSIFHHFCALDISGSTAVFAKKK